MPDLPGDAPTFARSAAERAGDFELATRMDRLAAVSIDCLLSLPLAFAGLTLTGAWETVFLRHQPMPLSQLLLLSLWGYVTFMAIHSYPLIKGGQTCGKYFVRIRALDLNGQVPPFWRFALLRYLPMQLFGLLRIVALIDVLMIFRGDRRCLHDFTARTQVVKA
jgi:uncharacterized RDD family membrane protein YckC